MEQGEHYSVGVRFCNYILGGTPYLRGEYHKWSFFVRYFITALLILGTAYFWFVLPIIIGIFVATKMQLGKRKLGRGAIMLGSLVLLIQIGYSLSLMPSKDSTTNAVSNSMPSTSQTPSASEAEALKLKQAEEAKRVADDAARTAAANAELAKQAELLRIQEEQQAQAKAQADAKAAADAEAAKVAQQQAQASQCDPNYTPCVPIASDVDCAGGKGNGPAYVRGPVYVIGTDIYGLDGKDNDGIGCE